MDHVRVSTTHRIYLWFLNPIIFPFFVAATIKEAFVPAPEVPILPELREPVRVVEAPAPVYGPRKL